jgi:ribonuclease P protein component
VLPRSHRLRLSKEFKQVYTYGRAYVHPLMILYVYRTGGPSLRMGFSIGKKLGGAVMRNRMKRRLREACRSRLNRLPKGYDLVFVGRKALQTASWEDMRQAIDELLEKARLCKQTTSR